MIDYEALILARQEQIEIMEDNGIFPDDEEITEIYNPIIMRVLAEERRIKCLDTE